MESLKKNMIVKIVYFFIVEIMGLWLKDFLVFSKAYNINYQFTNQYAQGYSYMNFEIVSFILILLIKVLFVVFIVSLAVGSMIAVKDYLFIKEEI